MARPKSEEKRARLLSAAIEVFAKNGLSASTASITGSAGMAEGTLFIYFKGKDDLINELYLECKAELAEAMQSGYPQNGTVRDRLQHIWNGFVEWGMQNPAKLATLHKIKLWEGLRPDVRDATTARFGEIHSLYDIAIKQGVFQDVPQEFVMAMLSAQAETTMHFMKQHPEEADQYKLNGFNIFWNGITRKE